jgi:hypothetical protein
LTNLLFSDHFHQLTNTISLSYPFWPGGNELTLQKKEGGGRHLLQPNALKNEIQKLLGERKFPSSAPEAGLRWAKAYESYARGAKDICQGSLISAPGLAALVPMMQSLLATHPPSGLVFNLRLAQAIFTFWTACALFTPGPMLQPLPGLVPLQVVSSTILAPVLVPTLVAQLTGVTPLLSQSSKANHSQAAQKLATALHTATMTVTTIVIQLAQPPGTVPPVPVPLPPMPIQ